MHEVSNIFTKEKTISSLEVAEMFETEHKEILRKLEGSTKSDGTTKQVGIIPTLTKGNFPLSDYFILSSYKDASGKQNKCYKVTKLGCDFLANKFTGEKGILFTAKYVKRFHEMEEQLKTKVPQTYLEALKELVAVEEEKERLQLELDRSKDWYSIKRVAALNDVSWKTFDWRKLKQVGEQMGYEVRKIFDANYGEVNTYHREVWETAYPRYEIQRWPDRLFFIENL